MINELYRRETGKATWVEHNVDGIPQNSYTFYVGSESAPAYKLHPDVQNWVGFASPAATYPDVNAVGSPFQTSLLVLNDSHRKTFKYIAEFIRTEPPGLFKE